MSRSEYTHNASHTRGSVKSSPVYKLSVATAHHIASTAVVIAMYTAQSIFFTEFLPWKQRISLYADLCTRDYIGYYQKS